jgi:Na+-translocating ferredoxin:NAD+ oxidoreductase RNF subunit RnfB
MSTILFTIIVLATIGVVAAFVLYFLAQKFYVYEDPRVDLVNDILPASNCGGCGYPGCRGFAEALVNSADISKLNCPVGGNATMAAVSEIIGKAVEDKPPMIAVVRCGGSPEHRKRTNVYDGAKSCAIGHALYGGETDCPYGCLGYGDCVAVCKFDAISIDNKTQLPVIDDNKCTSCTTCSRTCPRNVIEIRQKDKKNRKIFVNCVNKDKGGIAKKYCAVACTACTKCLKVCKFEAIKVENYLAYIDPVACKLCRKCTSECATNSIVEVNFPVKKIKQEEVLSVDTNNV